MTTLKLILIPDMCWKLIIIKKFYPNTRVLDNTYGFNFRKENFERNQRDLGLLNISMLATRLQKKDT